MVTFPHCLKHATSRSIALAGTGFSALTSGISAGTCFYIATQGTSYLNPPLKAGTDSQTPILTKPKDIWGTASDTMTIKFITLKPGIISVILASLFPTHSQGE